MSLLRQWQIVLLLLGIFLVGAVSGALLTVRAVKRVAANRAQTQNLVGMATKYYERQLALSPEQIEKLTPVFQETAQKVAEEVTQSRREVFLSMQHMHSEMEKVLTPEQSEKFKELRERARARVKGQLGGALKPRPASVGTN